MFPNSVAAAISRMVEQNKLVAVSMKDVCLKNDYVELSSMKPPALWHLKF